MGLSSSKAKKTETATVAPSDYNKPALDAASANLGPAYGAAQANINGNIMPRLNQSMDYFSNNIAGSNLNGNPYLDDIISRTNRDITTGVDSRFEAGGRYGSGNHAGILARALGDADSALRYQNYSTERGYQDSSAKAMPGVAGISAALPQAAAGTYADQVRALLGQYNTTNGTTTQKSSGSLFDSILQAAAVASKFIPGARG